MKTSTSTRGPNNQKKAGKKPAVKRNMKPKQDEANAKLKPAQKRKAKGGSSHPSKKVKVQDNWRPMSSASIAALENILDSSILSIIALKSTAKNRTQEHLNKIKNGFLAECVANIKVPPQKRRHLEYSSQQYRVESKKSEEGRKTLKCLEDDMENVVKELKMLERKSESLQHQCSLLRDQVEVEEEKATQLLELSGRTVLNLPPPREPKKESTLKARMRQIIPDSDAEQIAQKLGEILQKTETSHEQALLLQAQKHAEKLFSPAIGLNSVLPCS